MTYRAMCKHYGIKPLKPEDEQNTSDNEKIIRKCKVDIIDKCEHMRKAIDIMEAMAKEIEETDNKEHADIMVEFRSRMRNIWSDMKEIIVRKE